MKAACLMMMSLEEGHLRLLQIVEEFLVRFGRLGIFFGT
jgi:hypothetical protein